MYIVPPSISSKSPFLLALAPKKAPLSYPNSSLSISSSGYKAQLIWAYLPLFLSLFLWISFAIISLPVPVSPTIKTGKSLSAIFSIRFLTSFIFADCPIISVSSSNTFNFSSNLLFSLINSKPFNDGNIIASKSSIFIGFNKYAKIPNFLILLLLLHLFHLLRQLL